MKELATMPKRIPHNSIQKKKKPWQVFAKNYNIGGVEKWKPMAHPQP
jgi:hypothetical protein